MKERPILFSSPMIKLILSGAKSQTRRVMKPQPDHSQHHEWRGELIYEGEHRLWCWKRHTFENLIDQYICEPERLELSVMSPFGIVEDHLWVRETFALAPACNDPDPDDQDDWHPVYRADGDERPWLSSLDENALEVKAPWKPSIFMPRWASRITLEITEVRVQRLWEISEDDAKAEGVTRCTPPHGHILPEQEVPGPGFYRVRLGDQPHRLPFADLWDKVNGHRRVREYLEIGDPGYTLDRPYRTVIDESTRWEANPFVWAVSFRRVMP